MAIAYMTSVHIQNYEGKNINIDAWEYEDTLSSAIDGSSVIVPENIKNLSVTLQISAGSGKVQTTTSKLEDVLNNNAVWVDWDNGVVTSTTQDSCVPITAIRQVNVSGTTKLLVRAQ